MILQALTKYYDTLCAQGKLSPPGWDNAFKVSFALELDDDGALFDVVDKRQLVPRGKKEVLLPTAMTVPARVVGRTGLPISNFLADNASYLLGIDAKGKPERAKQCFAAAAQLHHALLDGVDSPAARAILAFFDRWDPDKAAENPLIQANWDELTGGANLIFTYEMEPVTEDPAIRAAWQTHYDSADPDAVQAQCLITGEMGPIARIHPMLKGVPGAQSSGAALVSFNAPAFCSYGHEQNANAPVSQRAAFAYTTALNTLLADREHRQTIGDTTVVCWAEHGGSAYQSALFAATGAADAVSETDLWDMLDRIAHGRSADWDGSRLDPNEHFYVLGLAPNAARLSARFFLRDTFGGFMEHIRQHYEDIAIARPAYDKWEHLSLSKLLSETVNQNLTNKSPSPQTAGDLMRAILTGTPYPATLLNGAELRIRAERQITRGRAAILKGYYLRQKNIPFPREVLTMNGNSNSTNIPYTLGRLFCVFEQIQSAANPNLNATIRDKYFNSASATPSVIFPLLGNLAQKHLRVIRRTKPGQAVNLDKKLSELSAVIGQDFPTRLTLPEQGAFQLGYYFENQARYAKSDKTKEE